MKHHSEEIIKVLEERMAEIITAMERSEVGSQEYAQLLDLLERATEVRNKYKVVELTDDTNKKKRWFVPVSGDAVISGLVSLAGIALIMKYEELDAITTKAFGIATKMIGR